MAPPLRVRLDQAAKAELERRYQTTRDATTRTRYQMILLHAEGHPVTEVARLTRCSPDTVRRVLKRYLAGGPDAVPHRPLWASRRTPHPPGRPSLIRVADLEPTLGWGGQCAVDLSAAGRLPGRRDRAPGGIETVRMALHRAGWVCKRPRWVLTGKAQAQPGWQTTAEVEALLGAAASPLPPPAADLVADATLADDLFPEDLPRLLGRADLYLQDEVESPCTRP